MIDPDAGHAATELRPVFGSQRDGCEHGRKAAHGSVMGVTHGANFTARSASAGSEDPAYVRRHCERRV